MPGNALRKHDLRTMGLPAGREVEEIVAPCAGVIRLDGSDAIR